jgi:hypothetical protein
MAFGDDEPGLRFDAGHLRNRARRDPAPEVVEPRPARDAVEVCIDLHGGQLQKLVERKFQRLLDESADLELPRLRLDARRAVSVEHGPLARARLPRRDAVRAPRVGADDHLAALELFRTARRALLPERVFEKVVEKTHGI